MRASAAGGGRRIVRGTAPRNPPSSRTSSSRPTCCVIPHGPRYAPERRFRVVANGSVGDPGTAADQQDARRRPSTGVKITCSRTVRASAPYNTKLGVDVRPRADEVSPGTSWPDSLKRFVPLINPFSTGIDPISSFQNKAALRHADDPNWLVHGTMARTAARADAWLWVSSGCSTSAVSFHNGAKPRRSSHYVAQQEGGDAQPRQGQEVCDRYSAYQATRSPTRKASQPLHPRWSHMRREIRLRVDASGQVRPSRPGARDGSTWLQRRSTGSTRRGGSSCTGWGVDEPDAGGQGGAASINYPMDGTSSATGGRARTPNCELPGRPDPARVGYKSLRTLLNHSPKHRACPGPPPACASG